MAAFRSTKAGERFRHRPYVGTVPISGTTLDYDVAARTLYEVKGGKDDIIKLKTSNIRGQKVPDAISVYWEGAKKAFDENLQQRRYLGVVMNTLKSLSKGLGQHGWMAHLPALSIPDPTTGRQTTFYSIYPLLGVIAELMALESPDETTVEAELLRLGQLRTYPLPPWSSATASSPTASSPDGEGEDDDRDNLNSTDGSDGSNTTSVSPLAKAVSAWLNWIKDKDRLSEINYHPHIIARIGARFYYTMQRFDDEAVSSKDMHLGNLIHRQIISFLNAVLVEERLALGEALKERSNGQKLDNKKVSLTNPTLNDAAFFRNMLRQETAKRKDSIDNLPPKTNNDGKINNEVLVFGKLPLFDMFFSCPIFALYVSSDSPITEGKWNVLGAMQISWKSLNIMPDLLKHDEDYTNVTKVNFQFNVRKSNENSISDFDNLNPILNSVPVLLGQG